MNDLEQRVRQLEAQITFLLGGMEDLERRLSESEAKIKTLEDQIEYFVGAVACLEERLTKAVMFGHLDTNEPASLAKEIKFGGYCPVCDVKGVLHEGTEPCSVSTK